MKGVLVGLLLQVMVVEWHVRMWWWYWLLQMRRMTRTELRIVHRSSWRRMHELQGELESEEIDVI